ncbi:uncharacterized protein LOC129981479 [Argiope bruennichi]|uniref:uncharacterized protein LOC129981479 n=1 Tax=Argiope bruennichi TaxID=94029 RepID=UPI0024943700|nr:uncharacterized protein LOC129981479 [Argiope bruennichi]
MALNFLPSLQHIAAVKVALTVYNDDIIHFFCEFVKKDVNYSDSFCTNWSQEKRIRQRRKEISQKLSTLLPKFFVDRIVNLLQPIVAEIFYCVRDHSNIATHIQKSHITNTLRWKSEGTIDRTETSKQLIRNESIDKRVRFVLASIYFLEQDVLQLWQSMTEEERENIYRIDFNLAVRFWMKCLRENAASPWKQWIPEYLSIDQKELRFSNFKNRSRRVRMNLFYNELNGLNKKKFLHKLCPYLSCDLRVCYYLTDETERGKIFNNSGYLLDLKIKDLLCFYLDWPLQTLFLDMVDQIWDHLTPECFEHCLCFIVYDKILKCMEDFEYQNLFKDLWNRIPDNYKEQFCRHTLICAYAMMRYDRKTSTLWIGKFLEICADLNIVDFRDV